MNILRYTFPNLITNGSVKNFIVDSLKKNIIFCCDEIKNAKKSVEIVSSYWQSNSESANLLENTINEIVKKNVKVRIVTDTGSWKHLLINRVNIPLSFLSLEISEKYKEYISIKSYHKSLLGTMHCKFTIIDGKIAIISSNNVQDRPNLEMSVSLCGDVVKHISKLFERLWGGNATFVKNIKHNENCENDMKMMLCYRRANGSLIHNVISLQNRAWWTLMSMAKEKIFIQSPTFNAKHAILSVEEACCRNIKVTIVLTYGFNDRKESLPMQGGTNKYVVENLQKSLQKKGKDEYLNVIWYKGIDETVKNCHIKYLSVDSRYCIFGNGNMDTQSWYHSMEVNVLIDSKEFTTKIDEILNEIFVRL